MGPFDFNKVPQPTPRPTPTTKPAVPIPTDGGIKNGQGTVSFEGTNEKDLQQKLKDYLAANGPNNDVGMMQIYKPLGSKEGSVGVEYTALKDKAQAAKYVELYNSQMVRFHEGTNLSAIPNHIRYVYEEGKTGILNYPPEPEDLNDVPGIPDNFKSPPATSPKT